MKIELSSGTVEIKPLPICADSVIDLLDMLQGLGVKEYSFGIRKDIILGILSYSEPKMTYENLIMADILLLCERFNELIAAALPMPSVPLVERVKRPGDEILQNSDEAVKVLKAAGVINA